MEIKQKSPMALMRAKNDNEIPKGAILVSKKDAMEHQMRTIQEWPSTYEVWPLKYSSTILGVASIASSYYVNTHFRRKLKLFNINKLSSYLPTVVLPAIMTTVFHANFITTKIVLQDRKCPVCVQTQAMAIQVGFGALYPCILGPISSFMVATRNYTFRLPGITENPMELLRIAQKMFRPIHGPIAGFAVFQAFLAAFLTYKEYDSFFNMQEKIMKEEEESEFEVD